VDREMWEKIVLNLLSNASDGVIHDYTEQRAVVEAMLRSTDQVFRIPRYIWLSS